MSKALCLRVSEPTERLAAQSTAFALRNRKGKQEFAKENENKKTKQKTENRKKKKNEKKKSESVKPLRYMNEFFSRLITFHYCT